MFPPRKFLILAFFALLLLGFAYMRLVDVYSLSWWTPEGGGGGGSCYQSTSGYALCGAIGQADAGSGLGSGYKVQSGFWTGARLARYTLRLPYIAK
jgi:hypothetical protein